MSSAMERSKKVKVKNGIDELTNDLLKIILSKMSLVEAARTSVLSRRWKNLWKYVTCLDFDASTVLSGEVLDESEAWYVAWVNKVTESLNAKKFKVQEFRVHFWLGSHYEDDLTKWIHFAVAKQVKIIHLNLSSYTPTVFQLEQGCMLSEEECCRTLSVLANLRSLKNLTLIGVKLTKQLIESILSSCLLLKDFSIAYAGNVADLNVLSSRLKYLNIIIAGTNVLSEIRAPKLESFEYVGQVLQPRIVDLPKLVTLSILVLEPLQILGILRPFGTQLPLLQHLQTVLNEANMLNFQNIPKLLNLKLLSIRFKRINDNCCRTFILLLNACPSLEALQMDFEAEYPPSDDPDKLVLQRVAKCHRLECLKEILFYVLNGDVFYWDFITDVVGHSPNLERVFINTEALQFSLCSTPSASQLVNNVKMSARNLLSKLPIGATLIFS